MKKEALKNDGALQPPKNKRRHKIMTILFYILGVLGILIIGMIITMVVKNNQLPTNLGVTDGQLAAMPKSPNAVSTQTSDAAYYVEPLKMKVDITSTVTAIEKAIKGYGGGEILIEEDTYIYVVFETGKMHYKDDVEFYIDMEEAVVHYRSASRIGYSDMGLNKERYMALKALYEAN